MNYIQMAGMLDSCEPNPAHREHIWQFTQLCEQCVRDLTPQVVREELENIDSKLWVKIQTQINGRNVDFPDVREYIREVIIEELKKMLKEIRL